MLKKLVPHSWVVDPVELPPNAVLDAPWVAGKPIHRWDQLAEASQKERNLILKASGFHETAWGARSVVLGSDVPRDEWLAALRHACEMAPRTLHILQEYKKPMRLKHPVYNAEGQLYEMEGRLRLCPFYFVREDHARPRRRAGHVLPRGQKNHPRHEGRGHAAHRRRGAGPGDRDGLAFLTELTEFAEQALSQKQFGRFC